MLINLRFWLEIFAIHTFGKHITKDIDIIFHLAALIAIPYSYVAADSYVDTNIKGTLNICQAARERA